MSRKTKYNFINTPDPGLCTVCNGSGEGGYDGSTCRACHGSGECKPEIENDDFRMEDQHEFKMDR